MSLLDAYGNEVVTKPITQEPATIPYIPGETPEGYDLLPYSQDFAPGDFFRTISDQKTDWVEVPEKEHGMNARQVFEGSDAYTLFETIRKVPTQ